MFEGSGLTRQIEKVEQLWQREGLRGRQRERKRERKKEKRVKKKQGRE